MSAVDQIWPFEVLEDVEDMNSKGKKGKVKETKSKGKEKGGKGVEEMEKEMTEEDLWEDAPLPQPDAKFGKIFDPLGSLAYEDSRKN